MKSFLLVSIAVSLVMLFSVAAMAQTPPTVTPAQNTEVQEFATDALEHTSAAIMALNMLQWAHIADLQQRADVNLDEFRQAIASLEMLRPPTNTDAASVGLYFEIAWGKYDCLMFWGEESGDVILDVPEPVFSNLYATCVSALQLMRQSAAALLGSAVAYEEQLLAPRATPRPTATSRP